MNRTTLALLFASALTVSPLVSAPAAAALPPEVKAAYQEYRRLLPRGKSMELGKAAFDAWQAAEDTLGDSKTTGDLAINYARHRMPARYGDYRSIEEAFERAIELAVLHDDNAADMEAQRWIDYAAFKTSQVDTRRQGTGNRTSAQRPGVRGRVTLRKAESRLRELGFANSTFMAEILTLKAERAHAMSRYDDAAESADQAIQLFKNAEIRIPSIYPLAALTLKARSLRDSERPVDALLVYQELTDMVDETTLSHSSYGLAVSDQFGLQEDVREKGLAAQAEAKGYRFVTGRDFEPRSMSKDVEPIYRVPPDMPDRARRSGWVRLKFDVDPDGRPINVKVDESSESLFEAAAKGSVARWIYATGARAEPRRGVQTMISFNLYSSNGNLLPPKKPKAPIQAQP